MWPRRFRNDGFDQKNTRVLRHIAADRGKDFDGFRICPVVNDVHQDIGVRLRHVVSKETATHNRELLAFSGETSATTWGWSNRTPCTLGELFKMARSK